MGQPVSFEDQKAVDGFILETGVFVWRGSAQKLIMSAILDEGFLDAHKVQFHGELGVAVIAVVVFDNQVVHFGPKGVRLVLGCCLF